MTYPVTVYRWDDPGAPQIAAAYGTANEIKDILQACLVTGYGSKAGLGWSKVFDDVNGVVWRNNIAGGGSGGMFRIKPKSGNWSAQLGSNFTTQGLEILSAKAFTDSSTADKPGVAQTIITNSSTKTAPNVYGWVLIGTAIGFYLEFHLVDPTNVSTDNSNKMSYGSNYQSRLYIGDIVPTTAGDAYVFTFAMYYFSLSSPQNQFNQAYQLSNLISASFGVDTAGLALYDSDGGAGLKYYRPRSLFAASPSRVSTTTEDIGAMSPLILSSVTMTTAGNAMSGKHPFIRGHMPGLMVSAIGGANETTFWPLTRSINGINYWLLADYNATPSSSSPNMWINMVEW